MVVLLVPRYSLFLVLLAVSFETLAADPAFSFSFPRFAKDLAFDSEMALFGDAEVSPVDSLIRISTSGRIMYRRPIGAPAPAQNPNPKYLTSLSTYFTFSVSNGELAFVVIPDSPSFKIGSSPTVLSVSLNASKVGIDVDGVVNASRFTTVNLEVNGGERLHAWIDYSGSSKRLEVRLSKSDSSRPFEPSASFLIDMSSFLRDSIFVALSASNASVYSWSFGLKHTLYTMHSEPLDPRKFSAGHHGEANPPEAQPKCDYFLKIFTPLIFGAACGAIVASFGLFAWTVVIDRRRRQTMVAAECPVYPVDFEYKKMLARNKVMDKGVK
ncbi:hypothetical protein QJS10_CPB14g01696 [Acorus calamus]|uniref:Legume lectin domain-containing protein n=1 Tax=Acorus calamus TaxID=4465 RepID=A0AAV9DDF0_ACOCL|nr:hypothetical protein QJS10_CPB14g01696 [Acorus calamus]